MFQPPLTGNFQGMIGRPQQQQQPMSRPGAMFPPMGGFKPQTRVAQPQQQQQQPFGSYTGPGGVQQDIADPSKQQMLPQSWQQPQQQQMPQQMPQQQFQPQVPTQQGMFGPKPFVGSGLMPGVPSLYQQPQQHQPQQMMYGQSDVMNDDSAYNQNSMTPQQAAQMPTGQFMPPPQQQRQPQQYGAMGQGVQNSFGSLFGRPSFQTNGYMRY